MYLELGDSPGHRRMKQGRKDCGVLRQDGTLTPVCALRNCYTFGLRGQWVPTRIFRQRGGRNPVHFAGGGGMTVEGRDWSWRSGPGENVQIGRINRHGQCAAGIAACQGTIMDSSRTRSNARTAATSTAPTAATCSNATAQCAGRAPGIPYWDATAYLTVRT